MQTPSGRPDRTLVVILSIIAAVVVLALVVVFTRGAPVALDPSTPEGVVQSYSNAVISGDRDTAIKLLTTDLQTNCENATTDPGMTTSLRLTLVSTKINGDRATVRVSVSSNPGSGAFGGSSYESDESFTLMRDGADWKIDTTPWELVICYKSGGNQ